MTKEQGKKTLGEFIREGHIFESIAFAYSSQFESEVVFRGRLGVTYLGVLVCDNDRSREGKLTAKFFYKSRPTYDADSDISLGIVSYKDYIINEAPLTISTHFLEGHAPLRKDHEKYVEAKKLLQDHGLY